MPVGGSGRRFEGGGVGDMLAAVEAVFGDFISVHGAFSFLVVRVAACVMGCGDSGSPPRAFLDPNNIATLSNVGKLPDLIFSVLF